MDAANSLHVIVRFHDSKRIRELDRAVFSLVHQYYRPLTIHIVTQRFSGEELSNLQRHLARYTCLPDPAAIVLSNFDGHGPVDGRSVLINLGFKAAENGRFLAILDYDDVTYHEGYQTLISRLLSTGSAIAFGGVVCKSCQISDAAMVVTGRERRFKGTGLLDLFRDNFCPIHSFVVDRSKISNDDLFFNERLHRAEDYDFLLRICAKYKSDFGCLDTVVGDYYFKDDGSNTTEHVTASDTLTAPWRYAVEYANLQKQFLVVSPEVRESISPGLQGNSITISELLRTIGGTPVPSGAPGSPIGGNAPEFVPAGHFYSPLPSQEDVTAALQFARSDYSINPLGTSLASQVELFQRLSPLLNDFHPPAKPAGSSLYYFENDQFSLEDASVLQAQMRLHKPVRIIEVGSGYSSAVMLDTVRDHGLSTKLTFVEPYPERLKRLVSESTLQNCTVIESKLQEAPIELFEALEAGDFLFIDSSHVLKAGSDLAFLFFAILPRLNPGVIIQIHDIFWEWEYPGQWLREGRAWNELYAVRAILQYSNRFEVLIHLGYLSAQSLTGSLCEDPHSAGSLWLRFLG